MKLEKYIYVPLCRSFKGENSSNCRLRTSEKFRIYKLIPTAMIQSTAISELLASFKHNVKIIFTHLWEAVNWIVGKSVLILLTAKEGEAGNQQPGTKYKKSVNWKTKRKG